MSYSLYSKAIKVVYFRRKKNEDQNLHEDQESQRIGYITIYLSHRMWKQNILTLSDGLCGPSNAGHNTGTFWRFLPSLAACQSVKATRSSIIRTQIQEYLGDAARSVPDHHNKAKITIK